MRLNLLLTLIDYKRIPIYLSSVFYAQKHRILGLRGKVYGMITIPECVKLYKLASRLPKISTVVEIGAYGGLSSVYILSGLRKNLSLLYSIDPFGKDIDNQKKIVKKYSNLEYRKAEYESLQKKPTKKAVEGRLKNLKFSGFQLIEDYSFVVVKKWRKQIDMLFIDGNHEYKAVLNDFNKWVRFLKKGGVIVFHDANNLNYDVNWNWGLEGPTKVVSKFICPPMWTNIERVDSIVSARKNY